MKARTIAVRHHPLQFAFVEIERRDASIWRLHKRQTTRTCNQFASGSAVAKVCLFGITRNEIRDEWVRHRRHVEHAGLRIERSARPVRAANASRQFDRAFAVIRSWTFDRGRREDRPRTIAFEDL